MKIPAHWLRINRLRSFTLTGYTALQASNWTRLKKIMLAAVV